MFLQENQRKCVMYREFKHEKLRLFFKIVRRDGGYCWILEKKEKMNPKQDIF